MKFVDCLFAAGLLAASAVVVPVAAQAPVAASPVTVTQVWSRAAPAGKVGVLYMTVTATAPDQLTAVTTPVAASADVHESREVNGAMTMRPVGPLPVGPGKTLVLAPGGYHVMLMGLKQPLNAGDSFPVTLTFAKAGAVTATASVAKAGAPAPQAGMGGMDMSHMDMGHMAH